MAVKRKPIFGISRLAEPLHTTRSTNREDTPAARLARGEPVFGFKSQTDVVHTTDRARHLAESSSHFYETAKQAQQDARKPPPGVAKAAGTVTQAGTENEGVRRRRRKGFGRNPLAITLKSNSGPGVSVPGAASPVNIPR